MSNLVDWAEQELARIGDGADEMQKLMNQNVLDIVKTFSEQGHSGFSAGYALNLIKRLLEWKPISAIEDGADAWNDASHGGSFLLQHKRCSAVFKHEDGTVTYIYGRVFSDDGGETWFTRGGCDRPKEEQSSIEITMPFTVPDEPERVLIEPELE